MIIFSLVLILTSVAFLAFWVFNLRARKEKSADPLDALKQKEALFVAGFFTIISAFAGLRVLLSAAV